MKTVFDLTRSIAIALAAAMFCAGALAQEAQPADAPEMQAESAPDIAPQVAPRGANGGFFDATVCIKHPLRPECVKACEQDVLYRWCGAVFLNELSADAPVLQDTAPPQGAAGENASEEDGGEYRMLPSDQ